VPADWRRNWGLRRFGFHGLSHAWAAHRVSELLGAQRDDLRLVVAHLGAGASLAAIRGGRSVDTTMGFTPLDGLVMATRSGAVDPGLLLWVQRHGAFDADAAEQALETRSGLLGLSERSGDLREIFAGLDAATSAAAWPSTSTCTGWRRRSRAWPPRWAASTRWPSRPVWAKGRRGCARSRPSGWPSWA
jgi:acetate kinase